MLLSDPTTKKAASAKAETWRQEIFDINSTFSIEGTIVDSCDRLADQPAVLRQLWRLEKCYEIALHHRMTGARRNQVSVVNCSTTN